MAYLIDTSAWLDAIRGRATPAARRVQQLVESNESFGICPQIYQELLQGASSEQHFDEMRQTLSQLRFYEPLDVLGSYTSAAHLYAQLRWQGITVRSTQDCMIAWIAIEHDLSLLHNDRDFERIAQVEPRLRLA